MVHQTSFVIEDAQAHHFPAEPFDILRRVRTLNREQDEQPLLNLAFDHAVDADTGLADSLNDSAHENS
jgi:hypothetical protein